MIRLNRFIAQSGIASRKKADELIKDGRVKVNGKLVSELGAQINENNDTVSVDDKPIARPNKLSYIMFHKPKGCTTTVKDEKEDRKTVFDYIDLNIPGLVPVGRLDYATEGLLILTNDGDLTYLLTHPSNEVEKTYIVEIEGTILESQLAALRNGVVLDDGYKTNKSRIKFISKNDKYTRLQVTITEGKNRQIRRMFDTQGKTIRFLKRIAIGDLRLGGLTRGTYRFLTDSEVDYLKGF